MPGTYLRFSNTSLKSGMKEDVKADIGFRVDGKGGVAENKVREEPTGGAHPGSWLHSVHPDLGLGRHSLAGPAKW